MTDLFDTGDAVVLDRTPAERWATCPYQALAVHRGWVVDEGLPATSGTEAHKPLAFGVHEFHESGHFDVDGIRDVAGKSRPDVQPDVLAALPAYALHRIRHELETHNRRDVAQYQGGKGDFSGQIARTLEGVTFTQEADLILWTGNPKGTPVLEPWDWKTGHKVWTEPMVRDAFQFRMMNWILRGEYPEVAEGVIWFRVVMTRLGTMTRPVPMSKRMAQEFAGRLHRIVEIRDAALATDEAETWPALDRCENCAAVIICPEASGFVRDFSEDRESFVGAYHVRSQKLAGMKAVMDPWVRKHGPIKFNGTVYGETPPSNKARPLGIVPIKKAKKGKKAKKVKGGDRGE